MSQSNKLAGLFVFLVLSSVLLSVPQVSAENSGKSSTVDQGLLEKILQDLDEYERLLNGCKGTMVLIEKQNAGDGSTKEPLEWEQKADFVFFGDSCRIHITGGAFAQGEKDATWAITPTEYEFAFHDGVLRLLDHRNKSATIAQTLNLITKGMTDPREYFATRGSKPIAKYIREHKADIASLSGDENGGLLKLEIQPQAPPASDRRHLIWLDRAKGMIPVKQQDLVVPMDPEVEYLVLEITVDATERLPNGLWYPKTATMKAYENEGKRLRFERKCTLASLQTEYVPSEEEFKIVFPMDYYVHDEVAGINYYPEELGKTADNALSAIANDARALAKGENPSTPSSRKSQGSVSSPKGATVTPAAAKSPLARGPFSDDSHIYRWILIAAGVLAAVLLFTWLRPVSRVKKQ
jgi:hypothetical protein